MAGRPRGKERERAKLRIRAVELVRGGRTPRQVAAIVGVDRRSIQRWWAASRNQAKRQEAQWYEIAQRAGPQECDHFKVSHGTSTIRIVATAPDGRKLTMTQRGMGRQTWEEFVRTMHPEILREHFAEHLVRICGALRSIIGEPVKMIPRDVWQLRLRVGGNSTLLHEPFAPYAGVQRARGFLAAVASGAPFADESGIHHVRVDERDGPEGRINTDSEHVIEDLPTHPKWRAALLGADLEESAPLIWAAREYVFAYRRLRPDHHSATVPVDIASATPRSG